MATLQYLFGLARLVGFRRPRAKHATRNSLICTSSPIKDLILELERIEENQIEILPE
jgi:hypothetical protein